MRAFKSNIQETNLQSRPASPLRGFHIGGVYLKVSAGGCAPTLTSGIDVSGVYIEGGSSSGVDLDTACAGISERLSTGVDDFLITST